MSNEVNDISGNIKGERITAFAVFFLLLFFMLPDARACSGAMRPESRDSVASADTVTLLREISVSGVSRRLMRHDSSALHLNVSALGRVMRAFGEADPLNYARLAGGVTAGSDYSSGLSVQGAGFPHTLYRVGMATVWFPYHFGGIYSMFNGMHFPDLKIDKINSSGSAPGRLGAVFDIGSRNSHPDRPHVSLNAGMTASSFGVRLPAGERFSIDFSGRLSYLDALYGPLLDMGDQKISYTFGEGAVTARWTPDSDNRIKLDLAGNHDRLRVLDRNYDLDTRLRWGNLAASFVWSNSGALPFRVWGTWSAFANRLLADIPGTSVSVPSSMSEIRAGGELSVPLPSGCGDLEIGLEEVIYRSSPQNVRDAGPRIDASESRVYVSWSRALRENLLFKASLKGFLYSGGGYSDLLALPSVSLEYRRRSDRFTVTLSASPQYVHQVGMADIGLSSNFWFPATAYAPRELSAGIAGAWSRSFFGGILDVTAEPYFRRILNEPEYSGMMLDLIDRDYSLPAHILHSDGFNTGIDLSARLSYGPLSALASYSFGVARRRFPSSPGRWLPAASEGLNSFNALISYALGRRWTLGACFTLASGRCYTPVKSLYMLGENLMLVYGARNSARLPLYHRLDLSGSYRFHTGGALPLTHTVVLSIINAYGRRNVELCSYRFSADSGTFYLHRVNSLYRFLPSVSYTVDF